MTLDCFRAHFLERGARKLEKFWVIYVTYLVELKLTNEYHVK